ncbi:MAG TPA: phospholipase D-like domain-containing protein [Anaerolineales bacterium]|nr:phospholipase D-like domain-containing protein [Anaerolineales bacterium]
MASKKSKSKSKSRKTKSKSNPAVTLLGLVVVLALGAVYYLTGNDPVGIFSDTETPTSVAAPDSSNPPSAPPSNNSGSSDWWEVYFTDPVNMDDPEQWQGSIEEEIIKKINAAKTSIHIASFEFDLTPVAEALVAAKQRGVEVQWVTDDEHGLESDEEPGHGQFAMLEDAGIEVRSDDRTALMHNKFWIFDQQMVWTGSTNITENGIFDQDNNVLVIYSPELAAIYEAEFQEMWNGEFGPRSPSQLASQNTIVNGSAIQVIFTSEDHAIEESIVPLLNSAETSIRFLAFSFTDYPMAKAMIDRAAVGVDVAGVFEKVGSSTDSAELRTLFCANVPARRDGNGGFMHNKFIIVDERYVATGSLNYSTNAETSNDENVIIIDNPDIARLYMQEFERVWSLAEDPEPEKFPCN